MWDDGIFSVGGGRRLEQVAAWGGVWVKGGREGVQMRRQTFNNNKLAKHVQGK